MTSRERAEALWETIVKVCGSMGIGSDMDNLYTPITAALDAHAKEAVEAEREAAARVCDARQESHGRFTGDETREERSRDYAFEHEAWQCAKAIRARSEETPLCPLCDTDEDGCYCSYDVELRGPGDREKT